MWDDDALRNELQEEFEALSCRRDALDRREGEVASRQLQKHRESAAECKRRRNKRLVLERRRRFVEEYKKRGIIVGVCPFCQQKVQQRGARIRLYCNQKCHNGWTRAEMRVRADTSPNRSACSKLQVHVIETYKRARSA